MYELLDITDVMHTKPLSMKDISVQFSPEYNRKQCPFIENAIDTTWLSITQKNKRIYNAPKFRLESIKYSDDSHRAKLSVNIGMTDYKETVCTNFIEDTEALYKYGEKHFCCKYSCFASPVGVTSIVSTNDDEILIIKRSQWVAESKGKCDTPGGHAEPTEMLEKLALDSTNMFQASSEDVVYEIFHSMVREVRDEVNIPEHKLTWPLLLGVMRNRITAGKPCFIFMMKCGLSSIQVKELYAKGGPETDESTELIFLKTSELLGFSSNDFSMMKESWSPCGLSALLFYKRYLSSL